MADPRYSENSVQVRVGSLEQDMSTVQWRLKALEEERLPTRMTQVENAVTGLREALEDIRRISHETSVNMGSMRAEVNADLGEFQENISAKLDNLRTRTIKLETKLTLYITGATVIIGGLAWMFNSPLVRNLMVLSGTE